MLHPWHPCIQSEVTQRSSALAESSQRQVSVCPPSHTHSAFLAVSRSSGAVLLAISFSLASMSAAQRAAPTVADALGPSSYSVTARHPELACISKGEDNRGKRNHFEEGGNSAKSRDVRAPSVHGKAVEPSLPLRRQPACRTSTSQERAKRTHAV